MSNYPANSLEARNNSRNELYRVQPVDTQWMGKSSTFKGLGPSELLCPQEGRGGVTCSFVARCGIPPMLTVRASVELRVNGKTSGIPHLATNERDVGHPAHQRDRVPVLSAFQDGVLSESGHLRTKLNKSETACVGMHVAKTNKPKESIADGFGHQHASATSMDISRPDLKVKKRRRQVVTIAIGVVVLAAVTFLVMRLKPAAPNVDRSAVWTDTVKRGPLVVQVRGLGTLVPREDAIRQIPAQTEATVVRILTLPGSIVKPDTILVELNDPTLSQEAIDAELSLREARADLSNVQVKVQSDLMAQKSAAATVSADYNQAQRQAQIDKTLYSLGVISGLAYSGSQGTADQLSTRNKLQEQTVQINEKAIESQLAVQQAKVAQAQAIYDLKEQQLNALKVRAGISGVLTDLPLAVGQHVTIGTMLAQVVQPNQLKAQLKIAETQARGILIGQPASIDTHNGLADGKVSRIDPAVQNGTVTVDVELTGSLPNGARDQLSVDGTIDQERLSDVLYVGRPAFGSENSTISLFKLDTEGKGAVRVPVKVGHASVNAIQVVEGLHQGDTVILSDMSRWDTTDRIRLD
jgi:HlyD family secretion protein